MKVAVIKVACFPIIEKKNQKLRHKHMHQL